MFRFNLLFLLSAPCICLAQEQLKGTVQSIENKDPVPYVNIVPVGRPGGTYSDETGAFVILVTDNDSLTFSSVGYKRLTLRVKDIKNRNNKVYLHADTTFLQSVTIEAHRGKVKTEKKKFGYLKANKRHTLSSTIPGSQFAVFIKNDSGQEGLIASLQVGIAADKKSRIRIRLYEPTAGNGVGREITRKNIFADVTGNHTSFEIDVSKYQIPFAGRGIIVAIEFLGEVDTDGTVKKEIPSKSRIRPSTRLYLTHGNDAERNTWESHRDRPFVRESFSNHYQRNLNVAIGLSAIFFQQD